MHPLHLTKVAVGCASMEALIERMEARAAGGAEAWLETRYRPTRHAELIGGSIYWIVKHRLVARQAILGFVETEEGRCRIRLGGLVVPVRARPKRAHQGWRYLVAADAPADFADGDADALELLPPALARELMALALI
ncbi:DUF1489 family protein [Sphingomonas jatrophae]|uniref:DUF1489 domain-containing protein n=1 Tax=Sphingomonas jatrophae TaxID=1166337 RepID=A0A1I6LJA0_9SPHN|nr:DUF1489 family protein [Sphingomonas jatrophae]SFS03418.1 hypothetical protein SAMN05192580_2795 [Sphingomonas jatrophae]